MASLAAQNSAARFLVFSEMTSEHVVTGGELAEAETAKVTKAAVNALEATLVPTAALKP